MPDISADAPTVRVIYLRGSRYLYGDQGLSYATSGSVGLDLRACPPSDLADDRYTIAPGERMTFPTGIAIEPVSPDMAGFIYSRSGLGAMHGLIVAQGVGVIDPDYRGEITVVLLNTSKSDKEVRHGERIAQIVFQPVWRARIEEVDSLATSARGEGGFGHSGKL